jgi:hypothetical protein
MTLRRNQTHNVRQAAVQAAQMATKNAIKGRKGFASIPIKERFWAKVVKNADTCWLWSGSCNNGGYGTIWFGRSIVKAHRLSWILEHGSVPDNLFVLHRCDVRRCVRPDHLFLGTNADNMADMAAKDRCARGSKRRFAKLSESDIPTIRKLVRAGVSKTEIGEQFGVTRQTIFEIATGKKWTHVPQCAGLNEGGEA